MVNAPALSIKSEFNCIEEKTVVPVKVLLLILCAVVKSTNVVLFILVDAIEVAGNTNNPVNVVVFKLESYVILG